MFGVILNGTLLVLLLLLVPYFGLVMLPAIVLGTVGFALALANDYIYRGF